MLANNKTFHGSIQSTIHYTTPIFFSAICVSTNLLVTVSKGGRFLSSWFPSYSEPEQSSSKSHTITTFWIRLISSWILYAFQEGGHFTNWTELNICPESKPKLCYDRRPVGKTVLVSDHHLRPANNFSFSSMAIIFRQFGYCYYEPPPLTRGGVCNLQLLLRLARAVVLVLSLAGPMTIFYCLKCEIPPTWRARFPYFFSLGIRWLSYIHR